MGDLNEIVDASEKSGGTGILGKKKLFFKKFIL